MGLRLPPLPAVRDLVRLYGLQATKSLSQNFLFNLHVTDRIARTVPALGLRCAGAPNAVSDNKKKPTKRSSSVRLSDSTASPTTATRALPLSPMIPPIIEVGAGPGALTRSVFRCGGERVVAVEMDQRFVPALEVLQQAVARASGTEGKMNNSATVHADSSSAGGGEVDSGARLHVLRGDILAVAEDAALLDSRMFTPTLENADAGVGIVGNLPFGVSTPLLLKWIRNAEERSGVFSPALHPFVQEGVAPPVDMVLMFQKEVAERIVAPVGSSEYSRLSVMTQRWFDARIAFHINPRNFVPEPKVWASVVHLSTRGRSSAAGTWPRGPHVFTDDVEFVLRQVFGFRRTMLRKALRTLGADAPLVLLPALSRSTGLSLDDVGQLRPHNLTIEQWCDLAAAWADWTRGSSEESPVRLLG